MDNTKKTLKSPLSAKNIDDLCSAKCPHCGEPATEMFRLELKAQIAGEAQKSIAAGILVELTHIRDEIEKLMNIMKEVVL